MLIVTIITSIHWESVIELCMYCTYVDIFVSFFPGYIYPILQSRKSPDSANFLESAASLSENS